LASFAQLLSAWLGRLSGKRKAIILLGASLQALMLIPLALLPVLFPEQAILLLILSAVLYFAGANLAAPQWCSLMGELVPERRRGRFFARRTRLISITSFSTLILAGIILDLFDRNAYTLTGYFMIFGIAFGARLVSVYYLWRMHDPYQHVAAMESPFQFAMRRDILASPFVKFSAFFALMQFSVSIASPFFIIYLLRDLEFSYLEYTVSVSMSVLMQFLALNRWGRISDIFGNRLILASTGLLIPFLPMIWLVSTHYFYILLIQAIGGMLWAGFSLSAGNYLYDLTPANKRATYLAWHNVMASIAVFCGALLGGYLGAHLPREVELFGVHYEWLSVIYGVFLVSGVLRLTVALLFLPRLKEIRPVKPMTMRNLIFRVARFQLSGLSFDIIGQKRRKPKVPAEFRPESQ
jgi:MFS family permease